MSGSFHAVQSKLGIALSRVTRFCRIAFPLRLTMVPLLFFLLVATMGKAQMNYKQIPGTYSATWLGNTYATGTQNVSYWVSNHVNKEILALAVASNGDCYTASTFDEGGANCNIYRNGKIIQKLWGTNGNSVAALSVAVNSSYAYLGEVGGTLYQCPRATGNELDAAIGALRATSLSSQHDITGLAADDNEVYAAVPADNRVYRFKASDLTPDGSFSVPTPTALCVEPSNGTLWIISGTQVLNYSALGQDLGHSFSLPNGGLPAALCVDRANRLLVADQGPDENIKVYTNIDSNPTLLSTFGVVGGVYAGSGPQIGSIGPLRFNHITGVGVDSSGNLYVSCNATGENHAGAVLECYTPNTSVQPWDGSRNWVVYGLTFEDSGDLDPATETDYYTPERHYRMNWSNPPGQEWDYVGATLDARSFPNDPRIQNHDWITQARARRIGGQLFLFCYGQHPADLCVYRFDPATHGEIAIPCGMVHTWAWNQNLWEPNAPSTTGWLWEDSNGDGQMNANEYLADSRIVNYVDYFWVDDSGNIWLMGQDPTNGNNTLIEKLPFSYIDSNGVPHWDLSQLQMWSAPSGLPNGDRWTAYLRLIVRGDTLYLGGITQNVASSAGDIPSVLARYDNWSSGNRTAKYAIDIRNTDETSNNYRNGATGVEVTGDYIFADYFGRPTMYQVWDAASGSLVGQMMANNSIAQHDDDCTSGLIVYKRSNGEYDVSYPDHSAEHTLIIRWLPSSTASTKRVDVRVVGTGLNQWSFDSSWSYSTGDEGWGIMGSNTANSVATFRFYGTQVKLFFHGESANGIAAISVDGGAETYVDTFNQFRLAMQQQYYTSPVLPEGVHTVRVRVTGQNNGIAVNTYVQLMSAEVVDAPIEGGAPLRSQLIRVARDAQRNVVVVLQITNTSRYTISNITVDKAQLRDSRYNVLLTSTTLPISLSSLAAGQSKQITLRFSRFAASGAGVLQVTGRYQHGIWGSTLRLRIP
jgi:hypothetical protein